jgi:hypothetical protein
VWNLTTQPEQVAKPLQRQESGCATCYPAHTSDTSATGDDGIGPAFLKHAVLSDTAHTPDHVLAPLLGRLFRAILCSSHAPAAWKAARLTPIFKKGDRSDPSNYRLIAVSPVVYWLFAGVVNTLLTRWCQKQNEFPKEQFGFFPWS